MCVCVCVSEELCYICLHCECLSFRCSYLTVLTRSLALHYLLYVHRAEHCLMGQYLMLLSVTSKYLVLGHLYMYVIDESVIVIHYIAILNWVCAYLIFRSDQLHSIHQYRLRPSLQVPLLLKDVYNHQGIEGWLG